MNISLPPELERIVKTKVESGLYTNETEVISEALRYMFCQENQPQAEAQISYNGVNFENTLAAYWAAFFDALGLSWKYYEIKHNILGQNITQQFQIEGHRCYFLTLPSNTPLLNAEIYQELSRRTGKEILVIDGPPQKFAYKVYYYYHLKDEANRAYYENEIGCKSFHFGIARRSTKKELCICPDNIEYCENHINLAQNITDDGERAALDGLASGLEEAYAEALKIQLD
ncbi:hypothetical protein [Desulfovibrio sp. JC010]|uniref:ribbon-helix-helix domain-containing protein n=1 Tax=Desulfovibrio sp. JC010 TaxID=2593641 RepID=UPI00193EED2D|nr:hypothetical protein [Desulfovibrio sp. JC010]